MHDISALTRARFVRLPAMGLLLLVGACDLMPPMEQPRVAFNPPAQYMGPQDADVRWYHISFPTAGTRITAAQRPIIDRVVREMRQDPNLRATVIGRADTVGADQANMRLSQERASAVRDALIRTGRISPQRIEVRWTGDRRPSTVERMYRTDADDRVVDIALQRSRRATGRGWGDRNAPAAGREPCRVAPSRAWPAAPRAWGGQDSLSTARQPV